MRCLFRQQRCWRQARLRIHFKQDQPAWLTLRVIITEIRARGAAAAKRMMRLERDNQSLRISLRRHARGQDMA